MNSERTQMQISYSLTEEAGRSVEHAEDLRSASTLDQPAKAPRDMLPASVHNMTFLIEKISEDCPPTQFLREFTRNGIDAIGKSEGRSGNIIWDIDQQLFQKTGLRKLSCIDTGVGMTGPEMVMRLNQWFASGQVQGSTANFGVGAKISALTRNKAGLIYQSWHNGQGAMIFLRYDPVAAVYGLVRFDSNGGEFWAPVPESRKPAEIGSHGTKVTFYGSDDAQDTTECPKNVSNPARWITRALNTRFFRIPAGITIRAREGWNYPESDSRHHCFRTVHGQEIWLNEHALSHGQVDLGDATAHWWILDAGAPRGAGEIATGGHIAALFQDELYEMATGRAGIARLQTFGTIFGADRVVIYVQPHESQDMGPAANASRSQVKINGECLDWNAWAAAFRERMPQQLVDLQHEVGARSGERNYREAIATRLRQMPDLAKDHRPSPTGTIWLTADVGDVDDGQGDGQDSPGFPADRDPGPRPPSPDVRPTPLSIKHYLAQLATDGVKRVRAEPSDLRPPSVHWVSSADKTRASGDLEERAARFLADQDTLIINRDFRSIDAMLTRWQETYRHVPGSEITVRDVVQEWFEQQLVEVIVGVRSLQKSGRWSSPELDALWSETALTAAVLPRWHVDTSIRRILSHRFGSSSQDA